MKNGARLTIPVLLALLFFVHVVVFCWLSVAAIRRVSPDSMNYIAVARNVVAGEGLVQSAPGFNQPTLWDEDFSPQFPRKTRASHNPGYALVLAGIAAATGWDAADTAFLLSAVSYAAALAAGFLLARSVWGDGAGLLAAAFLALVLRRTFLYAWTEPIAIACLLAMLALLAHGATPRRSIAAGLFAGLALFVRSGMLPVLALGGLACLLEHEHRLRRLLLFGAGASVALAGMFTGDGHVYPPHAFVEVGWISPRALVAMAVEFVRRTRWDLAVLAVLGLCAWWRARRDGLPIVPDRARNGCILAVAWVGGCSVFLVTAHAMLNEVFEPFSERLLVPVRAVLVVCCGGLAWQALAARWRPIVAAAAFAASMTVNIGYNAAVLASGREDSDAARIAESARRRWVAEQTGPTDFVVGTNLVDLPYFIRQAPDVASFGRAGYFEHVSRQQLEAVFLARCEEYDDLYLVLHRAGPDAARQYGDFVARMSGGRPAPAYALVAGLSDAWVYRFTGCARTDSTDIDATTDDPTSVPGSPRFRAQSGRR